MAITDYTYPNVEPTDYIDESLDKIKARDDASKCGFRRVSTFPIVTEKDVGMKIYMQGRGNFQLITVDPEPYWKQLTSDNRNPAYVDWVEENYQPISALLTSLAKLATSNNSIPYIDGPNDMQATSLTEFAKSLLAQTDGNGVRNALELGDVASLNLPLDGATTIAPGSIPVSAISNDFKRNMGWTTGDAKLTYKTAADDGWVMADDGSIGNQASGATTRANNDTQDLFMLMWNIPACEVQTFAGNASTKTTAIGDWSANKRLVLPKVLGRALGVAGSGEGLTTRDLGGKLGVESFTLTAASIPPHSHGGLRVMRINGGYSYFGQMGIGAPKSEWMKSNVVSQGGVGNYTSYSPDDYDFSVITDKYGNRLTPSGSNSTSSTFDNMQPTSFINVMIKL